MSLQAACLMTEVLGIVNKSATVLFLLPMIGHGQSSAYDAIESSC